MKTLRHCHILDPNTEYAIFSLNRNEAQYILTVRNER